MPGEINELDMGSALSDISDGLGFDANDSSEGLDDSGDLAGGLSGESSADGLAVEPGEGETSPAASSQTPAEGAGAPAEGAVEAPKTWRAEAAAEWGKLPPTVQQEILKREQDIFQGIEGYKADAALGKSVQSVIAPFETTLRQYGIDPIQHVGRLMQAHHTLALGAPEQKLAFFQKLAQDYGIDLNGLQPAEEQGYVDPEVLRLRQEVSSIKSTLSATEQQQQAAQRKAVETEVASFMTDPKNVYAKDLINDMVPLLQSGVCANLQEAYEKAMWTNPVVRAKELTRQQTEQAAKAAKDAEEKAAAARKATSANVRSRARHGGAAAPLGDMDDTLKETLASINARSS